MNHSEFSAEMNRLSEQWRAAYSSARIEVIGKTVKDMDAAWWKRTVDRFLGESATAPLLPQIRDEIAKDRERQSPRSVSTNVHDLNSYRCADCDGNGVCLAINKNDPGRSLFAFRCACSKGDSDPRKAIPQFKQGHADQGFVWADPALIKTRNA